ncbi:MAG TPA: CvpA family protein [Stellaceae bacterium]|nr:CvpA family protein [Stellaceae bacterium]
MNMLDVGVLVVVALSALFAFARGFVREALSILAWGGAAVIAYFSFNPVYHVLSRLIHTPLLAYVVDGAGVFLVSLILLTIATGYIARFIRFGALSPIDRTLGLLFGILRGVAVVCLAYLLLDISVPPGDRPDWFNHARSAPFLAEGADMLRGVLPRSLQWKSADMAGGGAPAIARAKAAEQAMRALANPVVPLPAKPAAAAAPSYNMREQRDLDRLIDNAR